MRNSKIKMAAFETSRNHINWTMGSILGGGGGDPSGLTLGLAPIGPVMYAQKKKFLMSASVRVRPLPPNT